jgi:hypothetical protein
VPSGVAFTVAPRTGDCPLEPRIGFEPPASPFLGMSVGILGTDSMGLRTGYANAQQSCLVLTGAGNRGAGTVRSQVPPACPCRHKIAENAGWDCELLAIELPPRRAPGARRPRHSDHRDGKALCLRRRKRWLITVWLEVMQKLPVGNRVRRPLIEPSQVPAAAKIVANATPRGYVGKAQYSNAWPRSQSIHHINPVDIMRSHRQSPALTNNWD